MTTKIRSRNWVFTLNNYTETQVPTELPSKCKYLAFSKEIGESGTPHLQGFCTMNSQTQLVGMKKLMPTAHWEVMRGTLAQSEVYCSKAASLTEFGVKPMTQGDKGAVEKKRWANIAKLSCEGKWAELLEQEPHATCVHLSKLKKIQVEFQKQPDWNSRLENYWIYGPPGTGKSFQIRQYCKDSTPPLYLFDKDQTKWWDTYTNEEYVLIDDLEKEWTGKHQLKRWSDRYEFKAQVKGGTLGSIRPRVIVVTSNYSIDETYPKELDPMLNAAIRRRFTEVHMQTPYVHGVSPIAPFTPTGPDAFETIMMTPQSDSTPAVI